MVGSLVREGIGPSPLRVVGIAPAEAFRAFVDTHLDEAYRLATFILGSAADAEDTVHDAAISAWRHWDQRRADDRTEAWFRQIVVNACRDRIRAKTRLRTVPIGLAGDHPRHPTSPDHAARVDDRDALDRMLHGLEADERVVLALRYGLDLTVPSIAAALGAPEGTVKSRLHRALGNVRRALETDR